MKAIHKYNLPVCSVFELEMPEGAQVLAFATQLDIPFLWALVETEAPTQLRRFRLVATGEGLPENETLVHIGTQVGIQGYLVFHLFEATRTPEPNQC